MFVHWLLQLPAGEKYLNRTLLLFLVLLSLSSCQQEKTQPRLLMYSAAGLQKPVSEIAETYTKKTGTKIEIQWGGSGSLLNNLQIAQKGDVYIAADASYIDLADKKKLIGDVLPLAYQSPVLVVQKDNPKNIKSLADLKNVRISCANPDAASIGKQCKEILGDQWAEFSQSVVVMKGTVNESLNDVLIDAVDAALIWQPLAKNQPVEVVELEEFQGRIFAVSGAVLKKSKKKMNASKFLTFMKNSNEAKKTWQKYSYKLEP